MLSDHSKECSNKCSRSEISERSGSTVKTESHGKVLEKMEDGSKLHPKISSLCMKCKIKTAKVRFPVSLLS